MSVSRDFVCAGNATFTIGTPGGPHRTYRVRAKEAEGDYPAAWFVSLLTGPDNTSAYTYLGMLDPGTGRVRLTQRSAFKPNSYVVRLINRVLARVWADDHETYEALGYSTYHAGKCGRCGRKLTVPVSIESGIGPECAAIMAAAAF